MNERNIHGSDRVRTCALRDIQIFCCLLYQRSYTQYADGESNKIVYDKKKTVTE